MSSHSPWDEPLPDESDVDALPDGALPEDSTPTLESEIATWRERSHILWSRSLADGDARGMASACQVALKGLQTWSEQERAREEAESRPENQPADQQPVTMATLDQIVRETQDSFAHCLCCGAFGDKARLRSFTGWLGQRNLVSEFCQWAESAPYWNNLKKGDDDGISDSKPPSQHPSSVVFAS